ncbi:hypothetical protein I3760_15G017400 [Carya illinoinensis]|nr:hypothetical protein I3760_15G017400 [Carya illinoinensis]
MPKLVINKLHKVMSSFFWRRIEGKPKQKWCTWEVLSKLATEGGLGLKNLIEVQSSLHMKLAWNLLHESSLWSTFFIGKYVGDKNIFEVALNKDSNFWRMFLKCIPLAMENSRWKIRDGKTSFWKDNWSGNEPLVSHQQITELPNLLLEECKFNSG